MDSQFAVCTVVYTALFRLSGFEELGATVCMLSDDFRPCEDFFSLKCLLYAGLQFVMRQ